MADTSFDKALAVAQTRCIDFQESSHLEWLHTNHTGAFAMGTVSGVNTRRYHGLLIASLNPPSDRYSIFPRVEETVIAQGKTFELAAVQYPGTVSLEGYKLLEHFSASPFPAWLYRCDELALKKTVRLIDGEQTVELSYEASAPCSIAVRLFVSFRDYHSLAQRNSSIDTKIDTQPGLLIMRPYANLPSLAIHHNASRFDHDAAWYDNHEYLRELERGLNFREDLYSPGVLHFNLASGDKVFLLATLEKRSPVTQPPPPDFADPLTRALDQFRVLRAGKRPTLMAGYPWFTDWSRDTLISLPALTAAGFPPSETKAILEFLLAERKQGILPNRFTDQSSAPEYNTVDASLWFFVAAADYVSTTGDMDFVRDSLLPAAQDIIDWHFRGTFYGIQVDESDHLLQAGVAGTQLTWMDAKIGDFVVTPRIGKPVEINALWFNALKIASNWAELLGYWQEAAELSQKALAVRNSFREKFWNGKQNCLFDVLTPSGPDPSLRPNQLFALSLPHPLLEVDRAKLIIQLIQEKLLTRAGLRTLAPSDPAYRPRFEGDMRERDSAYHQGTVWPWLTGPFIQAYLYAFGQNEESKIYCRAILEGAMRLMSDGCLGSLAEVYDGDEPQRPGGCPAQLWSVAQMILAKKSIDYIV